MSGSAGLHNKAYAPQKQPPCVLFLAIRVNTPDNTVPTYCRITSSNGPSQA
jgi:hypothetical protein